MPKNVAYCPGCKEEVTREEFSLESDTIGEHTVCGSDLWASEEMVLEMMNEIGIDISI